MAAHQGEVEIVESCVRQLKNVIASGIVVDMYEFEDDTKALKIGNIFRGNKDKGITFGIGLGENHREFINGKHACASFLVDDKSEQAKMEDVMRMGSILKHIGILKPIFVSQNVQYKLPKIISGFSSYDQSFTDWLRFPKIRGTHLLDEQKQIIITAYTAIEVMWEKGYTCDQLSSPSSHVMIGSRIKVLPHLLRCKEVDRDDSIMSLRNDFADFLEQNLVQVWLHPELEDFILLLRNSRARREGILGHPILLSAERRQLLYRSFNTRDSSGNKTATIESMITFSPEWTVSAPQKNEVLNRICNQMVFAQTVHGALVLADIASRHYVQHLKIIRKDWPEHGTPEKVDEALSECLPGLLSKRYALKFHEEELR